MADPLNPTPQNPSGNTVVVYDPNGTPHDVPQEELHNAVSIGKGMPAVWMRGPNDDETMRRPIPADQVQDAVKAGGKILPFGQQDIQHPGFWATMSDDLDKPITIGGEVDRPLTHAKDLLVNMARNLGDVSAPGVATKMYRYFKGEPGAAQELKDVAGKATETFGPMMFGTDVTPEERPPVAKPAPKATPPEPEGGMLGRAAEVAKRRIQNLPGVKAAKDIDYIVRGTPEEAPPTPKAPTPKPPANWGQGRYGTPVSQWGQRIPPPTPPDPFSQSTQSIGSFKLSDAPTKAVLQAVDELGPKATQDQIATRVQQIVKEPATPKGLQVPETPETTGEPVKGPLPKRFQPIRPEAPTPNQPMFDAKGNLTPAGKAVINKSPEPETQAETPQYPPEAPVTPLQPTKPTLEDVEETENIRQNVKGAAEREQRTLQRNIKGEYKERNDVSTPKGTLTGAAGEGNDVSLRGGPTAPPTVTQLPDIANPRQAMRQLENLQAAGASPQAIQEFEGRAATRFGDNWKHVASQHDNLTSIVQDSLEKANTDRVYAAIQDAEPMGNSISIDRLSKHPTLQGMSKADIEAAAVKLFNQARIHYEESGGGPHPITHTVAIKR